MHQVRQLWYHFLIRRRKQFVLLIILMFIASLAEIATIGAILPFLGVLAAPEQVFKYELMQPIIHLLQINNSDNLLLPLTVLFIFFALLAGSIRILLLHVMTRLSYAAGADLSINIYRRTLYQDYSVHVSRNSSEVINGIITKTNTVISNVISPILTFISSVIFIISILTALFMIDVVVALTSSISLGLLYWLTISYTSQQLKNNSQCIADQSTQMVKSLQEGLGGIRDVLIDGTQQFYCQIYRNADLPLRRASGDNIFINGSPRYMMEAIGMTMIAGLAYMMSLREGGLANTIPILGALALGAQRLLPALQQAYESYSTIKGSKFSLIDVLKLLDQPLPNYADQPPSSPIPFENKISLKNINFRYTKETPWVLKNVSLDIYKGDKIGFIGTTGSGKSTFLDIVMGLLTLKNGSFSIDGQIISDKNKRAWQAHISHVPQNIYLSDSSIEENIAFGIPKNKIDQQRVKIAAKQAQISGVIDEWENGYQTLVGEGGSRLSGGQRQRIGIARALYRQSNILILDEATSALDDETESAVMKAIEKLNKRITILIIAHRLTTLKNCNKIVKLDKDGMAHVTSYDDIMNLGGK